MKLRHLPLYLGQDCIRAPDEHAAVPGMISRAKKTLRGFLVGFFLEALHVVNGIFELLVQRFPLLDVTIRRGWERRRDAERDQVVLFRHLKSLAQQIME